MSRTVLLSTGAMTRDPVQTDHREIVRHGPGLGVPGFELGIFSAWYGHLDEVISDLRESGLSFPVVHAEKLIGGGLGSDAAEDADDALARLELNFRAAAVLGAKTLVLHLWDRPRGDRDLERNLDRLPTCLDTADLQGFLTGLVQRGYTGSVTFEATAVDEEGGLDPARLSQMAAVDLQLAS